jgi:5-hydroxyisourate hydrolase
MAGNLKRVSTHVLDTTQGRPAAGVAVLLEQRHASGKWMRVSSSQTDQDGRCSQLLPDGKELSEGEYRLTFDTGQYFKTQGTPGLYPLVEITFQVRGGESHFHLPLLLSPNGFTTYRGS